MDEIVQGSDLRADPTSKRELKVEPISKVGIVGSGQMGSGIAHVVALGGYDVAINDLEKDRFEAAFAAIDKNMTRQVSSGKISQEDRDKALGRITFAESFQDLSLIHISESTRPY